MPEESMSDTDLQHSKSAFECCRSVSLILSSGLFKIMKEEVIMTLDEHASKSISLAQCWFLYPFFVKACWNRENWSSLNPFFRDLFLIQLSCQITQILRRFSYITEHYLIVNIVTVTYFVVNLRWFLISFVSDHE